MQTNLEKLTQLITDDIESAHDCSLSDLSKSERENSEFRVLTDGELLAKYQQRLKVSDEEMEDLVETLYDELLVS